MPDEHKNITDSNNAKPVRGKSPAPADQDVVADNNTVIDSNTNEAIPPWKVPNFYQEQILLSDPHGAVHREDSMGDHWSVPWSDLMMVMFVLFAALLAANAMQKKVPEYTQQNLIESIEQQATIREEVPAPQPNFSELTQINVFEKSQQAVRETNIDNVEIVLMDDQSVKVSVQGPLFFDQGKDHLGQEVKTFLNSLSSVIRQTPYQVNVIGHTDDKPINNKQFASNWELSLMRATQVTKHLINEGKIDPSRFTIMGRSKYDPANPNANDEFRSLNRRVEIIITRTITPSVEQES